MPWPPTRSSSEAHAPPAAELATTMPPELRERLDGVLRDIGFGHLVGIEVLDWEPGRARTRLVPGPEQTNVHGFVHGGALFAVADTAFEVACNSYGRVCVVPGG